MKKILHLTVFLALVAAIAGGALGYANSLTAPIIEENELKAEKETLIKLYPDVSEDAFGIEETNVSSTIEKIFLVKGKGYVFKMKVAGYKDGTSFLVALNEDGTVYDYLAISNGDTQGIGSKVLDESFRNTLKGKDASTDDILNDTISGATVSSQPVLAGIREAATYQAANLK